MVPLGDVASFVMGQAPPGAACNFDGVGTPFVKAGEFGSDRPIIREWTTDPKKFAKATDVLICVVGATCGKINLGADCAIGRSVAAIRPQPTALDQFFLHYFLEGQVLALRGGSLGAAQTVISKDMLAALPIPLPPLDEQKRIVAVLDEAFEGLFRARANAEANLADARKLFAAALQAEFSRSPDDWRAVALSEIGKTVTGSTPRTSDAGNLGGDLPFIKPGDFLPDGRLDYANEGLSEKGAAVSRVLPPGCALMVCIGATIGKAAYSEQRIATNQQINALVPSAGVSGEFIYLQMISPDFQREVLRNAGQATLPIINKSKWSALKVRLPKNLSWQQETTDRMRSLRDVISDLEARYKRSQSELDTLRQSLLQKAFSGELT